MSTFLSSLGLPFYIGEDRVGMMGICSSGKVGMQTHMALSPNPMFFLFPLTSQVIVSSLQIITHLIYLLCWVPKGSWTSFCLIFSDLPFTMDYAFLYACCKLFS